MFGAELEDADAPVYFGFFADGEAVCVYECGLDVGEGGVEGWFVEGVSFEAGGLLAGCGGGVGNCGK